MESGQQNQGSVRVLGIDPGTRAMGYAVIDPVSSRRAEVVISGVLRLCEPEIPARLDELFRCVEQVVEATAPSILAIEDVFHGKNFQSVLKVGQARGVVMLAAQRLGLKVYEYSPRMIKKAVTGNGNADKVQVQRMMVRLLSLESVPEPKDVSDAMAVAWCHCQRRWRQGLETSTTKPNSATATRDRAPPSATAAELRRLKLARREGQSHASRSKVLDALIRSGRAVEIDRDSRGSVSERSETP